MSNDIPLFYSIHRAHLDNIRWAVARLNQPWALNETETREMLARLRAVLDSATPEA